MSSKNHDKKPKRMIQPSDVQQIERIKQSHVIKEVNEDFYENPLPQHNERNFPFECC